MSRLVIRGGRIMDPAHGVDGIGDFLIVDGRIASVGRPVSVESAEEIDARGLIVAPGLVDIHVHLREPGREDKETIATGTRSAVAGGFTAVCCMPNTTPVSDSTSVVEHIRTAAAREGYCRVHPIAAVTWSSEGRELTELGDLAAHGAVAFSDDGKPVWDAAVMRRALQYSAMLGKVITNHAEIPELVGSGIAHAGSVATRLGLAGVPSMAESACVARDIEIAAETGGRLHICHVSTARACELIAAAKARGIAVTGEVTPHHLVLTEDAIEGYNTMARVSPPLRSAEDRQALREALRSGVLDCVATDHAPHTEEEKDQPFDQVPPGMIGLDFAFALLYSELVQSGFMDMNTLLRRMSFDACRMFGMVGGTLQEGAIADLTIFDLHGKTMVTKETIHSRSCNTPFLGREFDGAVVETIVGGRRMFSRGRFPSPAGVPH